MSRCLHLKPLLSLLITGELINHETHAESLAGPRGMEDPSVHTHTGEAGEDGNVFAHFTLVCI